MLLDLAGAVLATAVVAGIVWAFYKSDKWLVRAWYMRKYRRYQARRRNRDGRDDTGAEED